MSPTGARSARARAARGIYALRPPAYAVASIASSTGPAAVVACGGTLYSLDSDRVVGIDGTTGAERTVTAGGLYDASPRWCR